MAERLDHDPNLAPPAEAIHMPEPSYLPVALAFAITITLLGILIGIVISIIGLILVIAILVRWIRSAREEMAELPREHH
jgi:ABC-type antimicrobial peptide transport system permease subunit